MLPAGSVLLSSRAPVGYCVIARNPISTNQGFKSLVPNAAVAAEYVRHYLLASRDYLQSKASGTTFLELSGRATSDLNIPIAPLNEQRRIVERIDELFSQIEAGEVALARARKLLERYRQAVLEAAVTGELTRDWRERHQAEIEPADHLFARILQARREAWEKAELEKLRAKGKEPKNDKWKQKYKEPEPPDTTDLPELPEGWVWAKLEALTSWGPQNGLYLPKSAYGAGTPILRINDYQSGWSRPTEDLLCVEAGADLVALYGLQAGDLVVNRVNSLTHLGKCILIDKRYEGVLFESNMMRLSTTHLVLSRYVEFYLRSELGLKLLIKNAKWAVNQASINQSDVGNTPIPVPPMPEQKVVIESVEVVLSECEGTVDQLSREVVRAAALRQSILTAAFAGKLVPQDPADEPAATLLDRIKAERHTTPTTKPRRGRPPKPAAMAAQDTV